MQSRVNLSIPGAFCMSDKKNVPCICQQAPSKVAIHETSNFLQLGRFSECGGNTSISASHPRIVAIKYVLLLACEHLNSDTNLIVPKRTMVYRPPLEWVSCEPRIWINENGNHHFRTRCRISRKPKDRVKHVQSWKKALVRLRHMSKVISESWPCGRSLFTIWGWIDNNMAHRGETYTVSET